MAWVHRISNVDEAAKTAQCSECGPVDVKWIRGDSRWNCGNKHRESKTKYRKAKHNYLSKYGITGDQALELLAAQGGVCKICLRFEEPFCVDHDHETGKVRGILCRKCNSGLGMFRDDPKLLSEAAKYLKQF